MDPTEHTGPVIDSGAETQQTRSINPTNTTVNGWLVDTCDSTGSGASPRPTSGITWPRQGISLDIGEASGGPSGPIALDDLTDVDTQTTAATDGQALVWDTQTQIWKPGTVSGTFRIQDAEDFELNEETPQTFFQYTLQLSTITATGQAYLFNSSGQTFINFSTAAGGDANGLDIRDTFASGATLWIVIDDAAPLVFVSDFRAVGGNGDASFVQYRAAAPEFDLSGYAGGELVKVYSETPAVTPKVPLADGDILRWNAGAEAFKPAVLNLDELDDVQARDFYKDDDPEKPYKQLLIEHLSSLMFQGYQVPAGEKWGMYANEAYGPTFGRYEEGGSAYAARRTYYDTNGIIHNLGNKPLWLNGALGNFTNNTPELRWTSGNPGDSDAANDGNFIGLKLPAGITTDTTYTFPLVDGTTGYVLRTDGAGALSWVKQEAFLNTGGVPITLTPGLVFNFEGDGNDTPTPAGNAPPSMSPDAAVGSQSLLINTTQADAQYLQGTWPASPFGNANHIGTQAFTFQTYFRNLNPELPGTLTRYHRMFSAASADGTLTNQVGGFQVRTGAGVSDADNAGAQGAMELFADERIIRGNTPITDDAWHHLCIQHDGLGNYVIFLDGAPDGTAKRAVPYEFLDLDGFIIGARNDQGADTFWMGHLDAMELVVGLAKYPATGFTPPTEPAGQEVTVGSGTGQLTVISDLNDVDTETTPPTDGQALVWVEADQEWKPGTVTGGGDGGDTVTIYRFPTAIGLDQGVAGLTGSWSHTATALRLSHLTGSGNIRSAVTAINVAGDVDFYISEDEGQTWAFVTGSGTDNGIRLDNPGWVFTDYSSWSTGEIDPANHTGSYWISFDDPTSGAVDSVNGETGVVSLGIQDMDDYELNQQAGVLVLPDRVQGVTETSPASEWHIFPTGSQFYYSPLQTILTDNLSSGDTITMQVPGMAEPFTTTLTKDPTSTGGGVKYFDISPNAPTEIVSAADGTALTITSPNLPGSPIPLAEGDILQWDDADQKFKPAQLPSAAPVDSVNGETGVVSLGIQEMDDFELNQTQPSLIFFFDVVEKNANPGADGESRVWDSGRRLQLYPIDANGADYGSAQAAASLANGSEVNVPVWTQCDEEPWVEHTSSTVPSTTASDWWSINDLSPRTSSYDGDVVTTLRVTFTQPVEPQDIPLAEGDLLKWDAADQKFKPAQLLLPPLPAGNGRATGTATAATLADAAAANLEITALGSAGMFLKVTTSHAAWVRFYADATTRAADTRTDSSVAPIRGDGVLLEVITTGAESYMVTPAVHYFQATPTSGTMHVKVTNRSGAEADIQVDVEALVLEP